MHLLRWNNISTQVRRALHQTCVFYSEGGWKPRKCFPTPVEGEIFSLTFPFIEQAIALIDPMMSAIRISRQLSVAGFRGAMETCRELVSPEAYRKKSEEWDNRKN